MWYFILSSKLLKEKQYKVFKFKVHESYYYHFQLFFGVCLL